MPPTTDTDTPSESISHTTVVVAGPDGLPWDEVVQALHAAHDLDVVAEVRSGEGLLDTVRAVVPHVVLLAIDLPGCEVLGWCQDAAEELPVCRVVLVSSGADAPYEAVAAGAAGAVSTAELTERVTTVVRRTARREAFIPSSWAERMLTEYAELHEEPAPILPAPRMTATEREVLRRLAKDATPDAVAALHEVPPRLVRLHTALAMEKLYRARRDRALVRPQG
jgi:two-component system response regulator DesR